MSSEQYQRTVNSLDKEIDEYSNDEIFEMILVDEQ